MGRRARIVVALAVVAAWAAAGPPPSIEVREAWVRWLPPTVADTAFFGVIVNATDHAVMLVGASTPAAVRCEPMTTVRNDTGAASGPVMVMVAVPALEVPAHGRRVLEPGGDHLMVLGLKRPLAAGASLDITLRFVGADPVTVSAPVLRK